jgi:hypothetical protein
MGTSGDTGPARCRSLILATNGLDAVRQIPQNLLKIFLTWACCRWCPKLALVQQSVDVGRFALGIDTETAQLGGQSRGESCHG